MHISVPNWCIVGYGTGVLWDLWDWSIDTPQIACGEEEIWKIFVNSMSISFLHLPCAFYNVIHVSHWTWGFIVFLGNVLLFGTWIVNTVLSFYSRWRRYAGMVLWVWRQYQTLSGWSILGIFMMVSVWFWGSIWKNECLWILFPWSRHWSYFLLATILALKHITDDFINPYFLIHACHTETTTVVGSSYIGNNRHMESH